MSRATFLKIYKPVTKILTIYGVRSGPHHKRWRVIHHRVKGNTEEHLKIVKKHNVGWIRPNLEIEHLYNENYITNIFNSFASSVFTSDTCYA